MSKSNSDLATISGTRKAQPETGFKISQRTQTFQQKGKHLVIFFLFVCLRWSSTLVTQTEVQWQDLGSPRNVHLLGSGNSPASASQVAGTTGACHHAQIIFIFLVETGFHLVDQDGLDLLTS